MGVSTAGSALIVFVAAFLAVGTLYTSGANAVERLSSAQAGEIQRTTEITATAVRITEATWNDSANRLVVTVENTGESTLSVRAITVLVDGRYLDNARFESTTVDGRDTDIWRPGTSLRIQEDDNTNGLLDDGEADRVKVVTGPGVAAIAEVTPA